MDKKEISISEVAKRAGVSKSTVSRILNNKGKFSKEVVERVRKIVKKYNYKPNILARSLRSRKTKAVGLILPSVTNLFFLEIIKGVEDIASQSSYIVILCDSDERKEKESMYFHMLEDRWVEGIIYSGVTGDTEQEKQNIEDLSKKNIPIVLIDREIEDYFTSAVLIDNKKAAFDATNYCINLGHRRIGFISGPLEVKIFLERLKGYRKALEKRGIEFDKNLVEEGSLTIESGILATRKLLAKKEPPSAIFASSDSMAIGAIKEIQKEGLKVPEDISVVGFDDIPLASLISPPLTTVSQPKYQMGREAMILLLRMIEEEKASKSKIILETKLVVRKSTSKPKKLKN